MLVRIVVFATTYPQLFDKGTLPGQLLLEQIQAAVQALSDHAISQMSGKGPSDARDALRSQLEAISRTAQGTED